MNNPYLIGDEVYLRPLERADAPRVAGWLNDPAVTRTVLSCWPLNLEKELAFIDRVTQSQQDLVLIIEARQENRPVGVTGLHGIHARNRSAAFGITIGEKDAWGRGYGTAATRLMVRHAFDTLNLNRVTLDVHADNERGLRAYARVGFVREGLFRQHTWREGRWIDVVSMAVLRDELPR